MCRKKQNVQGSELTEKNNLFFLQTRGNYEDRRSTDSSACWITIRRNRVEKKKKQADGKPACL